jgi:hypothetical protein
MRSIDALDEQVNRLAERLYPIPKVADTLEQDWRRSHTDLAALSTAELELEAEACRFRILLEGKKIDPWLLERLERIAEEMRRRG